MLKAPISYSIIKQVRPQNVARRLQRHLYRRMTSPDAESDLKRCTKFCRSKWADIFVRFLPLFEIYVRFFFRLRSVACFWESPVEEVKKRRKEMAEGKTKKNQGGQNYIMWENLGHFIYPTNKIVTYADIFCVNISLVCIFRYIDKARYWFL